jgi:hypothetical protein
MPQAPPAVAGPDRSEHWKRSTPSLARSAKAVPCPSFPASAGRVPRSPAPGCPSDQSPLRNRSFRSLGTASPRNRFGPASAAWSEERGRAAGQGESSGFSVRVWPDALLRLPAGEGSRLDLGLGWRGRLRSILSSPRFSGLSGQKNPSRGRVAEWLKAPDSKLFLPLWTDFLPLGQKCHFRPISLGFYNSHLDREGHRKTRFSTSSIQAEYTSGSIQVGGKQSDTGRLGLPEKIHVLWGGMEITRSIR